MTGAGMTDFEELAKSLQLAVDSEEFAQHLDKQDPLRHLRAQFNIPRSKENANEEIVYLLGNSTGIQPKECKKLVLEEIEVWANQGNQGHFDHRYGRNWVTCDQGPLEHLVPLVGAQSTEELAVMGTLTADLHLLMGAFYHPQGGAAGRNRIVLEEHAFPSDHVQSTASASRRRLEHSRTNPTLPR